MTNPTATHPEPALMLDVAAVARLLDVSPRHVWRLADAGSFPRPVSLGSKLKRWPRSSVERWIAEQAAGASRG